MVNTEPTLKSDRVAALKEEAAQLICCCSLFMLPVYLFFFFCLFGGIFFFALFKAPASPSSSIFLLFKDALRKLDKAFFNLLSPRDFINNSDDEDLVCFVLCEDMQGQLL